MNNIIMKVFSPLGGNSNLYTFFFIKFLLLEGDPSFLQTSASSGFLEFGLKAMPLQRENSFENRKAGISGLSVISNN